jgi:hypothetical protein
MDGRLIPVTSPATLTQAAQASGATAIAITGKDLVKVAGDVTGMSLPSIVHSKASIEILRWGKCLWELPEKCLLRQQSVADDSDEVRSFSAFWW